MPLRRFHGITPAERKEISGFSGNVAWMSCLFSPYGQGLSCLPYDLPEGSLLILSDLTPPCRQDPALVAEQLRERLDALQCRALLLDFQRPGDPECASLCRYLSGVLSCPVAVSQSYGEGLSCPVCLPPVPCHMPLEEYLSPWQGREVWLELALDGVTLTLTESGCAVAPLPFPPSFPGEFQDNTLHCHYRAQLQDHAAVFHLRRTREDVQALLTEAESLGVTTAVGLWQEFGEWT